VDAGSECEWMTIPFFVVYSQGIFIYCFKVATFLVKDETFYLVKVGKSGTDKTTKA
jgi:hypothetical protein